MHRKDRPGAIGEYWLSKRPNSEAWCKTWFDAKTRQTRRESLGVEDFELAKERLHQWYALNIALNQAKPQDVPLADVLATYWLEHGKTCSSASSIRVHLKTTLEQLEGDVVVADFGARAQRKLIESLRKLDLSDGTIKRTFATIKAAISYAYREEKITSHPPFIRGLEDGEPRERILTIDEMAALWDACETDYLRTFLIIMIATLCRPKAALDLTRDQCDLVGRAINLNPPGRARTKKRRPIVPMVNALVPWIEGAETHIVTFRGKPIAKINASFRNARKRAGLGDDVVPYSLRHTMASELARRGVDAYEVSALLGHVMPNNRTSARYVKSRPDWLQNARKSIDDVIKEIGRAATRPIKP